MARATASNQLGFGVEREDRAIQTRIERWREQVSDLRDFWRDRFAPKFLGDIQDNWNSEGGAVGGWAPLSPGYAAWKARRYGSHLGILQLSLRLQGSMQWLGEDIGPEGIFRATRTDLTIGTSVPYGGKHQYGDGVTRRRFLFIRDLREYDQMWRDWVRERAEESGIGAE